MPWKKMEVREQRVEFVVRALRGAEPMSRLCGEFGISRPTGYLWLARYREGGVAAIEERSRRPAHSPTQTAPELEARIRALRQLYPDWGARKLAVLLERQGIELPSSRCIVCCCASAWCVMLTATGKPPSALSANNRTSFGRWTSRGRRTGPAR